MPPGADPQRWEFNCPSENMALASLGTDISSPGSVSHTVPRADGIHMGSGCRWAPCPGCSSGKRLRKTQFSLTLPLPLSPVCQRPRGSWTWRALGGLQSLNSGLPRGSASEWMVCQAPKVRASGGHLQQGGTGQGVTALPKSPAPGSVSDCFLFQGFWYILHT